MLDESAVLDGRAELELESTVLDAISLGLESIVLNGTALELESAALDEESNVLEGLADCFMKSAFRFHFE